MRPVARRPRDELARLDAADCRASLRRMLRLTWPTLQTGTPLAIGWYIDVVADHVEAWLRGDIRHLIINLLNRSLKSQLASVVAPAWWWLHDPNCRFLTATYDQALARRDAWASRQLINSPFYADLNRRPTGEPIFRLVGDQNEKTFYANDRGGYRMATQVGAGTGKGGHRLIVDDPLSIDQSKSDVETETANDWTFSTLWSRQDDPQSSGVMIIQHRLRPDDPSGTAIARDLGFEVLTLPLEYDPAERRRATSIGFEDPRTEPGESLCPERWGPAEIAALKGALQDDYEAICNQRPSRRGNKPIKPEWIKRWTTLPARFDRVIDSWDTSFKGMDPTRKTQKRSRTAGAKLAQTGARVHIMDMRCELADFIRQGELIRELREVKPASREVVIEDEANGAALIASLGVEIPGIVGIIPKGSKYLRLVAVAPFFRAGNVLLPPDDAAPWVAGFVKRLLDFPSVEFDDEIDAISQGLSYLLIPDEEDGEEAEAARMLLESTR